MGLDFNTCTFAFRKPDWALHFRYDFIKITQHPLHQRSCFEEWFLLVVVLFVCLLVRGLIVCFSPPSHFQGPSHSRLTLPLLSPDPRAAHSPEPCRSAALRFVSPIPRWAAVPRAFPTLCRNSRATRRSMLRCYAGCERCAERLRLRGRAPAGWEVRPPPPPAAPAVGTGRCKRVPECEPTGRLLKGKSKERKQEIREKKVTPFCRLFPQLAPTCWLRDEFRACSHAAGADAQPSPWFW